MGSCEQKKIDLAGAEKEFQAAKEDWNRLGRPELFSDVQPGEDLKHMTTEELLAIRRLQVARQALEEALMALTDCKRAHVHAV